MEPLVSSQLNPAVVQQLQAASNKLWCSAPRRTVSDLIQVTENSILINPNSNKELGGECCIYEADAKEAIYFAFDLAINKRWAHVAPGRYEVQGNANKVFDGKAGLYEWVPGEGWLVCRRMNESFIPMRLPQTGDAMDLMRVTCEWRDIVVKGGYVCIEFPESARGLLNYFASLLTMDADRAWATILEHKTNKIVRQENWFASQNNEFQVPETIPVDGEVVSLASLANTGNLFYSTGNGKKITAGTGGDKALVHLAWLVTNGYELSRQA